MGNRVLITGGAGFIGRALVSHCVENGCEVTVLDNLCVGKRSNIEGVINKIEFHEADILDVPRVQQVMTDSRPQIVFHLAAHHFIPFCEQHPNETLRVNVEGTHVVLSEAARHGVEVAVIASTGALYPSQKDELSEELSPCPADVYGISKHMAEQLAQFTAHSTSMNCVVARLFNTYGPYETNPHLIPHIVESLRNGPSVSLGNIETKRDYIYVTDVAELLYAVAVTSIETCSVINLGTGIEHSAEEIVRAFEDLLGYNVEIRVDETRLRRVDKLHQRASTLRLQECTGRVARHSLVDGLTRLLVHEGFLIENQSQLRDEALERR